MGLPTPNIFCGLFLRWIRENRINRINLEIFHLAWQINFSLSLYETTLLQPPTKNTHTINTFAAKSLLVAATFPQFLSMVFHFSSEHTSVYFFNDPTLHQVAVTQSDRFSFWATERFNRLVETTLSGKLKTNQREKAPFTNGIIGLPVG